MAPTNVPSLSPSTTIPSATPTITGAVGIIELSKSVSESMRDDELTAIVSNVAETYGVAEEDVSVDVVYQTKGTMQVTIPSPPLTKPQIK